MFKLTGKKLFGVLLVAGVVASAVAGPAAADEYSQGSDPELVINAGVGPRFDDVNGSSIFPTVNDFQPITLNGTAKLAVATINPFVVIDDSGDEAGWNVTLQIADLLDGTGAGCATGSTHTIAGSGISMKPPVVDNATDDTSMTGVSATGFTDFTAARKIVVATATNGMGAYTVAPQLVRAVIPATAAAGTYCAAATIAVASGP